ncbi:hypothetical protein K7X08_018919 [Anisodus acutangulus]|uniref:Proteasome assembly chaperone 3 n=1 Tax=Anisodus acutangulus TaxID=402998 RepID=A0A9Q1LWK4_9SOLA|nr:hypothetical protein K7X08_018919 [Anisodus acutangulus]
MVPPQGSSTEGESGPKIRPKGVVDEQHVNIPVLPLVGPEGRRRLGQLKGEKGTSRRALVSRKKIVFHGGRGEEAMDIPVQQKKLSLDIKGNKTDIVICAYDDHFLVIATQIGSMGTILHARKEEGVSIHPTFSVSVLLGKRDEPMLVACARQIIEHISNAGSSRSLVLSLGLRDQSLPTLKGIVSAVTENCLW